MDAALGDGDRQRASESAANEVLDDVVGGAVRGGGRRESTPFGCVVENDAVRVAAQY